MRGFPWRILCIFLTLLEISYAKNDNLEQEYFGNSICMNGTTENCLVISNDKSESKNVCPNNSTKISNIKYQVIYNSTKDANGNVQNMMTQLTSYRKEHYVAIGISADDKMGDDAVIACHLDPSDSNKIVAELSFTKGKSNNEIPSQTLQNQLRLKSFQIEDSKFKCHVEIPAKLYLSDEEMKSEVDDIDLNAKKLNLFLVGGPYRNGELQKHDVWLISQYYKDFPENLIPEIRKQDEGTRKTQREIWKAHSLLMTLNWMVLIPIGIFTARFYKETWSETNFCKRRIWLIVHIGCGLIGFISCLIGYILIPLMNGQTFASDFDGVQYHRVLGIISISMVLFQCTINWVQPRSFLLKNLLEKVHSISGTICYLLGNVTILTTPIFFANTSNIEWKLMISVTAICWICLQLIYFIGMANYSAWTDKHIGIYPWRNLYCPLPIGTAEEAPRPCMRKTILTTFVGLSITIYTTVLIYVILSEDEDTTDHYKDC